MPEAPLPTEQDVRRCLDDIHDPCSVAAAVPMGLSEMGLVESVAIADSGAVQIGLRLTSPFCEMVPFMQKEAVKRVSALDGVTAVDVHHDAGLDWDHDLIAPAARARRDRRLQVMRRAHEGD